MPIDITAGAAARIGALAAEHDLPVPAFLLACWQTLIWRLTGHADAIVGAAFDARKFPELEAAIGLLSTYLPMQSAIAGDPPFTTVWRNVAERQRDAHRWQDISHGRARGSFRLPRAA